MQTLSIDTDRDETPAGPPPRRFPGSAVAWLVIVLAVVAVQGRTSLEREAPRQGFERDMALGLTGRYVVGMKSMLGEASAALAIPQLEKALDGSRHPQKGLFLAPVLVELGARERALAELERLAAEPGGGLSSRDAALLLQVYRQGSRSLGADGRRAMEKYGWTGALALSHDRGPGDSDRQAVLCSAKRTFVGAAAFITGAVAALVTGAILFIFALLLRRRGGLRARFSPPESPGEPLIEAFAIYLAGMIVLPALLGRVLPALASASVLLALPAVVLALVWPSLRGAAGTRAALGWHRGAGIWREIGAGVLGYLAGLPLLALALVPVMVLSRLAGKVPAHPIVNEINGDPAVLAFIALLGCAWAPVVEETFFRGMLFGYLRRRLHWAVSGVVTGLLFALIHPQGWMAVPVLGMIGFTLCAIRQWRGSIIAPMTAHALNNGVVLFFAFLMLA